MCNASLPPVLCHHITSCLVYHTSLSPVLCQPIYSTRCVRPHYHLCCDTHHSIFGGHESCPLWAERLLGTYYVPLCPSGPYIYPYIYIPLYISVHISVHMSVHTYVRTLSYILIQAYLLGLLSLVGLVSTYPVLCTYIGLPSEPSGPSGPRKYVPSPLYLYRAA